MLIINNLKNTKMEQEYQYAAKLYDHIISIFNEDSENYINLDELEDEENATAFIHALANVMPTRFFNKLTNNEKNLLEFNHIANQLVFQFSKSVDE